jgi:hypothetical protein
MGLLYYAVLALGDKKFVGKSSHGWAFLFSDLMFEMCADRKNPETDFWTAMKMLKIVDEEGIEISVDDFKAKVVSKEEERVSGDSHVVGKLVFSHHSIFY